jgi:hypothetical protein
VDVPLWPLDLTAHVLPASVIPRDPCVRMQALEREVMVLQRREQRAVESRPKVHALDVTCLTCQSTQLAAVSLAAR